MKPNQLVKVKILPKGTHYLNPNTLDYVSGAIGVITRVLKNRVEVRFREDLFMKFRQEQIEMVDVSKCETMSWTDFRVKGMNNSFKTDKVRVILGNEMKEYVGIGWVLVKYVEDSDLEGGRGTAPRVVDDNEHRLSTLGKSYGI